LGHGKYLLISHLFSDNQIMRILPLDTRPEAEKVLISLLRNANTAQKFAQVRSLSQTAIQLSRRAIARANRGFSGEQIDLRFITLHYGKELANNVKEFLDRKS
jgi:hypothetical protein